MEKSNPLTEEERTAIRERWDAARADKGFRLSIREAASPGALIVALHAADADVRALLAEVERLGNVIGGLTTVTGTVIEERNSLAEQVKHIRGRHRAVCQGACGLDDACECEERDLFCDECNEQWPCSTIRALDGSEAGR
jgi:hypothetical protein